MAAEKEKKSFTLYLMRHGSTGRDLYGRMVGSSEVPLGPEGPGQVREAAKALSGLAFSAFYASPRLRARQTAAILDEELGLGPPQIADELREVDFGRWELLNFAEIRNKDPELAGRWAVWSPDFAFPQGERVGDFIGRVKGWAEALPECEGNVLVVAHGGVVRALVCHFLGLDPSQYLLFDVKPAAMVRMEIFATGRGVITFSREKNG